MSIAFQLRAALHKRMAVTPAMQRAALQRAAVVQRMVHRRNTR